MLKYLLAAVMACLWTAGAQAQGFTLKSPPVYTGDPIGTGYTFSGVNSTLYMPNVAAYNITLPLSISMWVKYPTLAGSGIPYLFNGQNANLNTGFAISPKVSDANDSLLLQTYLQPLPTPATAIAARCAGPWKLCAPIAAISDGGLHHLCTVWSAVDPRLYIDGVPRAWGVDGATMLPNTTDPWSLGLAVPSGTNEIDVAAWNRELGADECALIYNRGLAGKSLLSGNAPATLNINLIAYWKLSDCGGSPTACPDSSPTNNPAVVDPAPTLAITAPVDGTTGVTGIMSIAATCTDTLSVTSVAFSVDGFSVATDTALPYTTTFDTTLLLDANNPHTVTAVCTNLAGVTSTANNTFSTANTVNPAKTYYLNVAANGGSDSNDGLARTVTGGHGPWLTPNHSIRCGDTILAQPSQNYVAGNFAAWGQVLSCPPIGSTTGPFWAYLKCEMVTGIQDCYIKSTTTYGMAINRDHWSIENWHITATGVTQCTRANPVPGRTSPDSRLLTADKPIYLRFLNNYFDSCGRGPTYGWLDYWVVVGNLSYNNAFNSAGICDSGFTSPGPFNFNPADTGTHTMLAGNFVINNGNPPGCTDGEGVIYDDWNIGASVAHPTYASGYDGQNLFTQNLIFGNSSHAVELLTATQDTNGVPAQCCWAQKYLTHSTSWGNGGMLGPGAADNKSHGAGAFEWVLPTGSSCGTNCVTAMRGVTIDHNIMVGDFWAACFSRTSPYTCPPSGDVRPFNTLGGSCSGSDCHVQNNWIWNSMLAQHADVRLATAVVLPANTYNNGTSGVGATLTATANGALTVDSVAVATNDRILVKNEVNKVNNGIYVVTATGSGAAPYVLTRASDANTVWDVDFVPFSSTYKGAGRIPARSDKLSYGVTVKVTAGSVNINKVFMMNENDLNVFFRFTAFGTDKITWGPSTNVGVFIAPVVTNAIESDPVLAAPAQLNAGSSGVGGSGTPTAIDCSHSLTAYACMQAAGFITKFQPTAAGTAEYGYPIPSTTCFDGSTPGYAVEFSVWPVWVKGTLGASGTYVTLPCGW